MKGLVYIGKITGIDPIPDADFIERLDVVCGSGGKWSGCAPKGQFKPGDVCDVYLQDSIVPQTPEFEFMARHKYRVRMVRLRGVPSECLIMPHTIPGMVGEDVTRLAGVEKYEKPIPFSIGGEIAAGFPSFIPKTDEPNFQSVPDMVSVMLGQQFVATEKADGTSTTVYKHDGHFGVCTRNWEIRKVGESGMQRNAMWQLAERYDLESKLPEGIAIQWETVGPKIQKNPLGLKRMEPYVFDVWFIGPRRYGSWTEMVAVAETLGLPTVRLVEHGAIFDFDSESLRLYAEGTYPSGKQREGVVIRPVEPQFVNGERLSFKVVNLKYKE